MVDIREEATSTNDDGDTQQQTSPPNSQTTTNMSILAYLRSRGFDSALWGLRLLTMVFTFLYLIPLGGMQQQASYYAKTLTAAAATNALRLHQRLGGFQLSRTFFQSMFLEDSCHYLLYSVLFLGCSPVAMALLPVFLFALLHMSSFTVQMLSACGMQSSAISRNLVALAEQHGQNLLSVIACTEIFLMPMMIIMIFMGQCSLLVPFIYYRFLTLRYMSRRNPNTKMAFAQMRMALEMAVNRDQCPTMLRNAAHSLIAFLSRLAPQPTAA